MISNFYSILRISMSSLIFILSFSFAQKPPQNNSLQIIPDEAVESITSDFVRYDINSGVPVGIYKPNYLVNPDTPQRMAEQYLSDKAEFLKVNKDLSDLKYLTTKETKVGYHIHFAQYKGDYLVYNSTINVTIDKNNRVVFVMNGYKVQYGVKINPDLQSINISTDAALVTAKSYLAFNGSTAFEKSEAEVYYNQGKFRLAQVVTIIPSEEMFGQWEVMVDAQTGEIFRVEDKACYSNPWNDPELIDGTGYVFDPDPITHARTTYGSPGFSDNNDADSDSLTAHRELRTLYDITYNGSVYSLVGPWAEIRDFESPFTGLHTNPTSDFLFTRNSDNFEAVNTYFHIDNSMRWINNSLGITLTPYQYVGGVRFDPHGLSGDDNSHYLTGTGSIAYGDGGVDDAEDLGVILHELGHGIHDWITSGGLSQVEGLSEGCGDYWATSYVRSTGYWTPAYPAYYWVFIWDGHNPFWPGRIVNYTAHYPEGLTGVIHTDGQMWASSLMSIYDLIGRTPTDIDFLEGLAMTNGSSNQPDAANAFIAADQLIYGGSHFSDIIPVFVDRGYLEGPITADFMADVTYGPAPLTVHFTDLSISQPNPIVSWQWDFDNDGTVDATEQNPTWVYNDIDIYTVKLTVSDGTNSDSETKADYINVHDPNLVIAFNEQFNNMNCWTAIGPLGSTNWTVETSNNAEGSPPSELQFSWSPEFDGLSKFRSCNIITPITGTEHHLTLKHMCDWFDDPAPFMGIGVSYDNGNTYSTIWQFQPTGNVDPETIFSSFTPTSGTFQLVLYINGNSYNIDYWYVDDIQVDYVVPVELTSFTAAAANGQVILNWTTATETNNQGFEIERSLKSDVGSQNSDWTKIGFVAGFGTTTEPKSYSFIDDLSLNNSQSFSYRLKQIDFDGTIEYSEVINVNVEVPLDYTLEQNYPNPFNPNTTIKYSIAEDGFVKIAVYNNLGEEVASLVNNNQKAGRYEVNFNASDLSSGVYFYLFKAGEFISTKKMILLK
jgi:PKD repeat protein/predicted small secreted protein